MLTTAEQRPQLAAVLYAAAKCISGRDRVAYVSFEQLGAELDIIPAIIAETLVVQCPQKCVAREDATFQYFGATHVRVEMGGN